MSKKDIEVRCSRCGSADVQVAMFVNPNTGKHDGEWLHDDQRYAVKHGYQWCNGCGEHVILHHHRWDEDEFRGAERRAAFIRGFKKWVKFDSTPEDPVEAVGFNVAADINENGGGERPVCADAVDECIHFFDREED